MRSFFVRYFSGSRIGVKVSVSGTSPGLPDLSESSVEEGLSSPILANWKVEEHGKGYPRYIQTRSLFQLSKQERKFPSHVLRQEWNKNLFLSVSGFKTRTRIEIKTIIARMFENIQECNFLLAPGLIVYNTKEAIHFCKIIFIYYRTQVSLVRSLGPDFRPSKTFCRPNWCDSGWLGACWRCSWRTSFGTLSPTPSTPRRRPSLPWCTLSRGRGGPSMALGDSFSLMKKSSLVFSCPDESLRQLYTYPCHSLTHSLTHNLLLFDIKEPS